MYEHSLISESAQALMEPPKAMPRLPPRVKVIVIHIKLTGVFIFPT